MLKLFKLIFIISFIICNKHSLLYSINYPSTSSSVKMIECSPQLKKSVEKIQKLPEAQRLIERIQQEGPIKIVVNQTSFLTQFGAFWDAERRIITVNLTRDHVEGMIIGSILFELHNAYINSKLSHLAYLASIGKIDKESYVQGVERLEYQNSLDAAHLAEIGIRKGIFPANAKLPTYSTFDEHYDVQRQSGHSAWIANAYEEIRPKFNRFRQQAF